MNRTQASGVSVECFIIEILRPLMFDDIGQRRQQADETNWQETGFTVNMGPPKFSLSTNTDVTVKGDQTNTVIENETRTHDLAGN